METRVWLITILSFAGSGVRLFLENGAWRWMDKGFCWVPIKAGPTLGSQFSGMPVVGCFLPTAILPKMNFFCRFFFFLFFAKSVDQSLLDVYFYLLLSLKLFPQKRSVLLKLHYSITLLRRLDQSKDII